MKKVFYIIFLLFGGSLYAEGEVNTTQPEEEVEIATIAPTEA